MYLALKKINGPDTIKRTDAFRVAHGFSLKRELVRAKLKIKSAHEISFGIRLPLNHVGAHPRATTPVGKVQANKMEGHLI
jgi:hypothetical protein